MLYLPRRFRRRLLLPIGWVALSFLLLLGCWLLGRQPKQWQRENIVQLTMPLFRPDTSNSAFFHQTRNDEYRPYFDTNNPRAFAKLARMRPWQSFVLLGKVALDSASLSGIETAVKAIQADTGHAGGVRVRMGQQVTHRELVKLLDMMSRLNQEKYWLDIVHRPTTFYIVTPRPPTLAERQQMLPTFSFCGTSSDVYLPVVARTKLENLHQPERRPQLLLTMALAALLLAALAGTLTLSLGLHR